MPQQLHDFLFHYYGLDWAAALFMFISMHRLGIHKKDGFVFAALASACWIAFNIIAHSAAGVLANLVIAIMAIRSLAKWRAAPPTNPDEITPPAPSED